MVEFQLDLNSLADYRLFLKIKALPSYRIVGRTALVPEEYAQRLGRAPMTRPTMPYRPLEGLFDYQRDIARLAIRKQKFAAFVDPGYGKTLIAFEYVSHVLKVIPRDRKVLLISPLMVIRQTIAEADRFYGSNLPIRQLRSSELAAWLSTPPENDSDRFAITNYEALKTCPPSSFLGCLILDESQMLKSAYGKFGAECIRLGKGLDWKLCLTGTPAPNDRIEFANHAVFLDVYPTVNSFLARYFINRGETSNRWELKAHALESFYRSLSHWSIFLTNPSTYGWKDNAGTIPPILTHIHDVDLTDEQNAAVRALTGTMFVNHVGGITNRSKLARIAKLGDSKKPAFIRNLIESWPDESTLIWARFNPEQDRLAAEMPDAASLTGTTKEAARLEMIEAFKNGWVKTLISKPKLLGLGLNLQIATRHIFSSLHDSYEDYCQCVKRSNRVGSTVPLNVHVPLTEVERPMVETVLTKAHRIQQDTEAQERTFKECGILDF